MTPYSKGRNKRKQQRGGRAPVVQGAGGLTAHHAGLEALDLGHDEVVHHLRRRAAVAHAVPHLQQRRRHCRCKSGRHCTIDNYPHNR